MADKLSVTYVADGGDADTVETLTAKILLAEPTETQLNACTVDDLKVFADCLEMTYTYTNKKALVALILAEIANEA